MQALIQVSLLVSLAAIVDPAVSKWKHQVRLYTVDEMSVIYRAYNCSRIAGDENGVNITEGNAISKYFWPSKTLKELIEELPNASCLNTFLDIPRLSRHIRESRAVFKTLQKFRINDEIVLQSPKETGEIMVFSGYGPHGITSGFVALFLWMEGYNVTVVDLPDKYGKCEGYGASDLLKLKFQNINGHVYNEIPPETEKTKQTKLRQNTNFTKIQNFWENFHNGSPVSRAVDEPGLFKHLHVPMDVLKSDNIFNEVETAAKSCSLFLEGHMSLINKQVKFTNHIELTLSILNRVKSTGSGKIISIDSPMMSNDSCGMVSKSKLPSTKLKITPTYLPDGIISVNFLPSFLLARSMRFKAVSKKTKTMVTGMKGSAKKGASILEKTSLFEKQNKSNGSQYGNEKFQKEINKFPAPTSNVYSLASQFGQTKEKNDTQNGRTIREIKPNTPTRPTSEATSTDASGIANVPSNSATKVEDDDDYMVVPTGGWQLENVDMALVIFDDIYNFMDDNVPLILNSHEAVKIGGHVKRHILAIPFKRPVATAGRPFYNSRVVHDVDGVLYVKKPLSQFDAPMDTCIIVQ